MSKIHHGPYSTETVFDITQHRYAASGHIEYVDLLEILNPPEGKERFAVNHYHTKKGHEFCEVATLELAHRAFLTAVNNPGNNVPAQWRHKGIEKIYATKSPIVKPWFYAERNQLFGKNNEFATTEPLVEDHPTTPKGATFLLFLPESMFSFETVAGVMGDAIIWESSSSCMSGIRMINVDHASWKDQHAIQKWRSFLSTGKPTTLKLEFPIWSIVLGLSIEHGILQLDLTAAEEFKGQRAEQTYRKKAQSFPNEPLFTAQSLSGEHSLIDVIKFFITE